MAPKRARTTHSVFDVDVLDAWLATRCAAPAHVRVKHRAVVVKACAAASARGARTLRDVTFPANTLPNAVMEEIYDAFVLFTTKVAHESSSKDGATTKMIVELEDGHRVEACVMRHAKGGRVTLCVSSQVGCKMGCTFCATGTLGELGNLTTGEIVEQLAHANALPGVTVRNCVFMGMGEPLNNYDAVIGACGVMRDGFGLASSKITVSTVGVIPRMRTLTRDAPGTCLALSLHAPTQELRQKIVPTATAYKLDELMRTLDEYLASGPKMKTMIEYCVLGGVNDDERCAHQLGELLRGKEVILNLIPLNPTDTPAGHVPPKKEDVQRMMHILTKTYDIFTTVRHTMGDDIDGACGQLALKVPGEPEIEDLMSSKLRKKSKSSSTTTSATAKVAAVTARERVNATAAAANGEASMRGAASMERALVALSVASAALLVYSVIARRSRQHA